MTSHFEFSGESLAYVGVVQNLPQAHFSTSTSRCLASPPTAGVITYPGKLKLKQLNVNRRWRGRQTAAAIHSFILHFSFYRSLLLNNKLHNSFQFHTRHTHRFHNLITVNSCSKSLVFKSFFKAFYFHACIAFGPH